MSTLEERMSAGGDLTIRDPTLQDLLDWVGIKPGDSVEVQQEKVAAKVPYTPHDEQLLVEAGLL